MTQRCATCKFHDEFSMRCENENSRFKDRERSINDWCRDWRYWRKDDSKGVSTEVISNETSDKVG